MRIILVLMLIAGACGFFGFHKYTEKRHNNLLMQLEREREKYDELNKNFVLLQQKLLLETMKNSEPAVKPKENQENDLLAAEKFRLEQEKQRRLRLISAKEDELEKLKTQLRQIPRSKQLVLYNTENIAKQISETKQKIAFRENMLRKVAALINDNKFACFDACIRGTDIKFERKMTRTCKSVVSGGIYFCEHYDMTGSDYCTRHLRTHRGWDFPNRYRDDHITAVRYLCQTHKVVWDSSSKNTYMVNHRHSRVILGNRTKYMQELRSLRKNLTIFEGNYHNAISKNNVMKQKNKRSAEQYENQRQSLVQQISALEQQIANLKNENI